MQHAVSRLLVALIIILYVALAFAYAVKTPKWNVPDEPAHFNYVAHVATTGTLPVLQMGDYDQRYLEQLTSTNFPEGQPVDAIRYESHQPPLYYLVAAGVYRAAAGATTDAKVLLLRALSIVIGAVSLVAVYVLAREALPSLPLAAFGAVVFVAGVPMRLAMSAAVNNDTLSELVLTLVLLVTVRGLRRGWTARRCLLLGLLLGAALLTKVTIYFALALPLLAFWLVRRATRTAFTAGSSAVADEPGVVAGSPHAVAAAGSAASSGVGVGQGRRWRAVADSEEAPLSLSRQLLLVYGPAVLCSGWWFIRNGLTYGWLDPFGLARHEAVVVGQPRTVFSPAALEYFVTTTFQSFWAQFGWMGILVDRRIYVALAILCSVVGVGFAIYLYRLARRPSLLGRGERWSLVVLGLAALSVLVELLYYNLTFVQAQGRYLFPAIAPLGIFFTLGVLQLSPRFLAPIAVLGLYLALLALDYVCLVRFVAPYFGTL